MINFLNDKPLLAYLKKFKRLFVGFSGGLDSTVLLHLLSTSLPLKKKLTAIHIHHGLSQNAAQWQKHCELFCQKQAIPMIWRAIDFDRSANIEENARLARLNVFSSLLTENDAILLGHHQDDQAETVLLQLFRGAGIDGLAAMAQISTLGKGELIRPLLTVTREQLKRYAVSQQLNWIEDETNLEVKFTRNFIRHEIIPILEQRWPSVSKNIARTAELCQQARQNLQDLAGLDLDSSSLTRSILAFESLLPLRKERIANVLRFWLKFNGVKMPSAVIIERIIDEVMFVREDAEPMVQWEQIQIRRYRKQLFLLKTDNMQVPEKTPWPHFPEPLKITDLGRLVVNRVTRGLVFPEGSHIDIRFRRGGELFYWHGQSKQLKKLFQEWNIPPWLRDHIPLIYINDELALVVGYAVSDKFYKKNQKNAWEIQLKFS
ncbi:tRNA lysidine(34) synthetase TilS [Legionella israelensis]|uniref:tRNA lysidine(34) synthetase TilS n=1 Tax=Legionella israelensis TaxID=454 RepID=UPI00073035E4|nr:tRNA lysidine(34) synthetase TilS [Legionella israelensis]QBS08805.1 tRNA lysidine(34) synthetase TilS [Legionella israelensis]